MTTTHLLLDIEGTTCPISFVSQILFPYANQQLHAYLRSHQHLNDIQLLISEAWKEWQKDQDEQSQNLLRQSPSEEDDSDQKAITTYLQHLIHIDKKSTVLKDLQGKIWKNGYNEGSITSDLYPEACAALKSWHHNGVQLAVYSSGSVNAQQLLYEHTPQGDMRSIFCGWFDTRTGPKKEAQSYRIIAKKLAAMPEQITFISDNQEECNAARQAGLATLFSLREGNPDQDPGSHRVIQSLDEVVNMINR